MCFHIYNDCHHFGVLENLKKKKLLGSVKKNTFCVQMGDWTQNMIFLMTYIETVCVKSIVSKKFSFSPSVIRGVMISMLVGPSPNYMFHLQSSDHSLWDLILIYV